MRRILSNAVQGFEEPRLRPAPGGHGGAPSKPASGILVINAQRSAYAGPLGYPSAKTYGSLSVYASLGKPFCIRVEGRTWENVELAVAPAYVPHLVSCERHIGVFRLESETVDPLRRPSFLPTVGAFEDTVLLDRIRDAFARLRGADPGIDPRSVDMDTLFLGVPIAQRHLDPRIALIAERIRQRPCAPVDADTWAEQVDLSCSRFLHLFKYEIGASFRRFRAWKRARSLLPHLSRQLNLSDLALELGYPDATHFSHSIRNFYGFSPKELFTGGRRFVVVTQHEPARITLLAG